MCWLTASSTPMTRQSRCCCRAIRRRRPGGCGRMFVMTIATPGQRWRRRCGSFTARTEKASTRRPILPVQRCAAGGCIRRVQRAYRDGRITEAACWAHARRKIHDVHVRTPSALTEEALKRIGELYAIEAEIRGMTAEQRLAERQLKTKPLLKSPESWLREKMKPCRDTFRTGESVRIRPEPVAGADVLCR